MVFVLIFSVYLIYLFKATSTKAGGTDHLFLFTYANICLLRLGFRCNIQYIFVYLLQSDVNKSRWKRPSLFTYENDLL